MASLLDALRTFLLRFDKTQRVALAWVSVCVLTVSVCVLVFFAHPSRAFSASDQTSPMKSCCVAEPAYDASNDMESLKQFGDAMRQLLREKRYAELNCIADSERSNKELFAGGRWKLHELYWALTNLRGHVTPEDRLANLQQIQSWVDATPKSITARIALAQVYVNYAWDARGVDTSDTVSENGWKLFGQRLEKAKAVLDEVAALPVKCPEWYFVMQEIALGQGWDKTQSKNLLQTALAFAPEYYYYYRSFAYSMMPQWNGENGDAANFAAQAADRVGGGAGDMLYFQIGSKIVCACNEPESLKMSWARLQRGHDLLEKKYGVSLLNENPFAVMAVKNQDWSVADHAFKRIADNWSVDVWITHDYFNQMRDLSAQMGPRDERAIQAEKEAEANRQAPGGPEYQSKVEQVAVPVVRQCLDTSGDEREKFMITVQIGKNGGLDNVSARHITTLAGCVMGHLYEGHVKNETPFPVPPHAGYWVNLEFDPSVISGSASN